MVLATVDAEFARQLCEVLECAGLAVERTDDLTGTELAGCAKNAAALAAAAASPDGMNAAGAAAGRVFGELYELALARGARAQTLMGLAGTGDLVATALAEGSRNRRAGQMLGDGVPREHIAAALGETAEALDTVPLLARALEEEGIEAPVTRDLAALVQGRLAPATWISTARGGRAAAAHRAA